MASFMMMMALFTKVDTDKFMMVAMLMTAEGSECGKSWVESTRGEVHLWRSCRGPSVRWIAGRRQSGRL